MTDAVLVAKVLLTGDKQAFGHLVDRHQTQVRRLLLKLSAGNSALADDLAQESFIRAYLKIKSLKLAVHFGPWLYRIAYNVYLEHRRRARDCEELSDQHDIGHNAPIEQSMDIYAALSQLREEERVCISMSYIEGFAHSDIAQITGMPLGTVKTNINRGREKLRHILSA